MGLFSASPAAPRRLLGRPGSEDLATVRLPWLLWGILAWGLAILSRLIWLQVVQHKRFQAQADQQHTITVPVPPIRGEIRDRRGEALAISLKAESLFVTPRVFYPNYRKSGGDRQWGEPDRKLAGQVAARLAPILELPRGAVMERLLRRSPFVFLERQLPASKVAAIKALDLEGLEFLEESRRMYPRGSLASQIIGFVNVDGLGQLGIEQSYETMLAGRKGEFVAARDARGRLRLLREQFTQTPANGSTLQLTLDSTIQHIVEEALEEAVRLSRPATAYAVVVDPNTGEILAMAGTPRFDPNQILPKKFRNRGETDLSAAEREELRAELERQKAARKVHPVEDAYEPGSTMKVFTAAMALEERKVHLGEKFDCMGGRWVFSPKLTINDTHRHGVLSFEEVLWQSSNVGAAKMGMRLDPGVHFQYLHKFGFGEPTGLAFPGETNGRLPAPGTWSAVTQPTLSYGYGLSASPLQVLMAGCAIANGGKLMKPLLVSRIYNDKGALLKENRPEARYQVMSDETSALMREALKGVVTSGTAKKAKLDGGVEAFGKTGTSRKIINGAYDPRRHFASFMGFFPAEAPQYGILVMLDDPAGDADGGSVAAPVFKRIGDAILRYRQTGADADRGADLKLSLRDWPLGETDEAVVHVEEGKVPDLKDLSLKAAIQRIVMVGGVPRIEGRPHGIAAARVRGQSPEPGADLRRGQAVIIRLGEP